MNSREDFHTLKPEGGYLYHIKPLSQKNKTSPRLDVGRFYILLFLLRSGGPNAYNPKDYFQKSVPQWLCPQVQPGNEPQNPHDEEKPAVNHEKYPNHDLSLPLYGD
jgi:hypothetical protein